jgi:hypothetical protein
MLPSDEVAAADASFNARLREAESLALDKIAQRLPFANMQQTMTAFKLLNGARLRGASPGSESQAAVVTIVLPSSAAPSYVTNSRSEIVEVAGRALVAARPEELAARRLELATAQAERMGKAGLKLEPKAVQLESVDRQDLKDLL